MLILVKDVTVNQWEVLKSIVDGSSVLDLEQLNPNRTYNVTYGTQAKNLHLSIRSPMGKNCNLRTYKQLLNHLKPREQVFLDNFKQLKGQ